MELFNIDPEMVETVQGLTDEDLISFTEIHGDPNDEYQIELLIYLLLQNFKREESGDHLESALVWAEGWVEATSPTDTDRMRLQIFDFLTAEKSGRSRSSRNDDNPEMPMSRETLMERMATILSDEYDDRESDSLPDWVPPVEWLQGVIDRMGALDNNVWTVDMIAFFQRCTYLRTKHSSDLRKAAEQLELRYKLFPTDMGLLPQELGLSRVGDWSYSLFELESDMEDLNRAIWAYQTLAQATSATHSKFTQRLATVGTAIHKKFNFTQSAEDLNATLEAAEATFNSIDLESSQRLTAVLLIVGLLKERFKLNGDISDIDRAIELLKPQSDKDGHIMLRSEHSEIFLEFLTLRFASTSDRHDLELGILTAENYLKNDNNTDEERYRVSSLLSQFLAFRFQIIGDVDVLKRGIDIMTDVMKIEHRFGPSDRLRAQAMFSLGCLQGESFQAAGKLEDLEAGIANLEAARDSFPGDSPSRISCVTNLSGYYMYRYEARGCVNDIHLAIKMLQDARQDESSFTGSGTGISENTMGLLLSKRFQCTGNVDDLDEAISFLREAVSKMQDSSLLQTIFLSNLGTWIGFRFDITQSESDLNEYIDVLEASAKGVSPSDGSMYSHAMGNLGTGLSTRHTFTGSVEDIHRAIQLLNDSLEKTATDSPLKAKLLINLSSALGHRFTCLGATNDLTRAVACAKEAVDSLSLQDHGRPRALKNLADRMHRLFEQTGSLEKLDQSLEIARISFTTTPPKDPYYHHRSHTLASILLSRHDLLDIPGDIEEAIKVLQTALDHLEENNPSRARYLAPLAVALTTRFEHTMDVSNLEDAIRITEEVLESTHTESHDRGGLFLNLTHLFMMKLDGDHPEETRQQIDQQKFNAYIAGFSCINSHSNVRVTLGRNLAVAHASRGDWEAANMVMKEVIALIPSVSDRTLSNRDKQASVEKIESLEGLSSLAAAISLNAGDEPKSALQHLEQGRGIISGILTELRTEISDLRTAHPDLARRFEHIRDQLDLPEELGEILDNAPNGVNRPYTLQETFKSTIEEIRGFSGFENFLCPLTEAEIKSASSKGAVVVVNIAAYRCDTFIIHRDQIDLVPLPDLNLEQALEMAARMRTDLVSVLEWLWKSIASPVLKHLGFSEIPTDEQWPHLWWVSAGLSAWFPLHAAGIYTRASDTGKTVLDRVISSYSSSVKSLVYSRKRPSGSSDADKALLVSMPQTSGASDLPNAAEEVKALRKFCPELGISPIEPAYPTRDNVLDQLKNCKIFHFAGHGLSHSSKPSQSCLLVHDWQQKPLTVGHLRDLRLHEESPFLSFLSACSTSSTSPNKLIDEGIHLVNACQLDGFRHVVGTLWEVLDEHCVDVAEILYSTLQERSLTDEAVALGLHRAIRHLRRSDLKGLVRAESVPDPTTSIGVDSSSPANIPSQGSDRMTAVPKNKSEQKPSWYWVPYVHFGV